MWWSLRLVWTNLFSSRRFSLLRSPPVSSPPFSPSLSPSPSLNLGSPCLYLPSSGIIGMHKHALFMCVCVCTCVQCADAHIGVKVRGLLLSISSFFWGGISHWTWISLFWLDWLPRETWGSSCLCHYKVELPEARCHTWLFHMCAAGLHSGPHACMADAYSVSCISTMFSKF